MCHKLSCLVLLQITILRFEPILRRQRYPHLPDYSKHRNHLNPHQIHDEDVIRLLNRVYNWSLFKPALPLWIIQLNAYCSLITDQSCYRNGNAFNQLQGVFNHESPKFKIVNVSTHCIHMNLLFECFYWFRLSSDNACRTWLNKRSLQPLVLQTILDHALTVRAVQYRRRILAKRKEFFIYGQMFYTCAFVTAVFTYWFFALSITIRWISNNFSLGFHN